MARLKIAKGTQAAYDNLWRKDNDTFYICTDSQQIYLGVTLLFSGDRYKSFLIDNNDNVIITTFGVDGAVTINLNSFTSIYDAAQAIVNAVNDSYKFIRNIAPDDITSSLLSSSKVSYVYDVYYGFTVGHEIGDVSSDLFTSEANGRSYSAGTGIVVINTGTIEDPVLKFNILTTSEINKWSEEENIVSSVDGKKGVQWLYTSGSTTSLGFSVGMDENTECRIFILGGTEGSFGSGTFNIPCSYTAAGVAGSTNDTIIIDGTVYFNNGSFTSATTEVTYNISTNEILELEIIYSVVYIGGTRYTRTIFTTRT